ncbi:MAG: hypothetical protein IPK79_10540 [Vampirovibrionales bacterium]|nr:hypothetical protein [Vampirovibrionales bacterium]
MNRGLRRFVAPFANVAALIAICALMIGFNSPAQSMDLNQTLRQSWRFYQQRFMPGGERVESNNYGGSITEGQSYALMKAVWMGDRPAFDAAWRWTRRNMARPDSVLPGWRWGKRDDGHYGLIASENATDADQDIAYALLLAFERWGDAAYRTDADAMIAELWQRHVHRIAGRYYLDPGDWPPFVEGEALTINPSYMAPYVYRAFARYDAAHADGWRALANDVYPALEACSALSALKLPPNWCAVNYQSGAIGFSDVQGEGARDFGYDAFRVFWRMAMDAREEGGSAQARAYLAAHDGLWRHWLAHRDLPEGFGPKGEPRNSGPSGFSRSALFARQAALDPARGQALYQAILGPLYHPEGYWQNDYNDFMHSVVWLHVWTARP